MPILRRVLLQHQQNQPQHASSTTTTNTSPSPQDQQMASDSDVVLILAALLCAFICVAGLGFIARCAWLRRRVLRATGQLPTSSSSSPQPPPPKGIDSKVLRALPKLPFHPDLLRDTETPAPIEPTGPGTSKPVSIAADCAICLTEFAEGDEVRVLPQCGHGFHATCVDAWLKTRSSCPSCRSVLVVVDGVVTTAKAGARCDKCGKPAGSTTPLSAADGGADFLP